MKPAHLAYWILTALLALAVTGSGVFDLMAPPEFLEGLQKLGYPPYLATLLGLWKLLAVVALLAPGFGRLKEWAYAGLFFDFTGAAVSHAAVGDPLGNVATPLVLTGLLFASWALRPTTRRMPSVANLQTA